MNFSIRHESDLQTYTFSWQIVLEGDWAWKLRFSSLLSDTLISFIPDLKLSIPGTNIQSLMASYILFVDPYATPQKKTNKERSSD